MATRHTVSFFDVPQPSSSKNASKYSGAKSAVYSRNLPAILSFSADFCCQI
jgi:hypothetical protein